MSHVADHARAPRRMLAALPAASLLLAGHLAVASPQEAAERDFTFFDGPETFDASIPSPREALGYEIGEHFTRHADLAAYLTALAAASDRVVIERYGQTHQRRGLFILSISAPANLARLEEILRENRRLADPATDAATVQRIIETNPAIAWFSFNVHGNEASSTEAAIQLAYTLAASQRDEIRQMLEQVILVIDPLLNPDGHERYVSWYQNTVGAAALANPDASEHHEPWPGGRTNHYSFDLNRDWVWLVHPESRARLAAYRRHLPQLHIDHHEQGYTQPFFFGAGDEPYNVNIPEETRAWVERYGNANAAAFDRQGLVYSTKERFDYLYPGYGKVLPTYHGAIGMLAEQAGHSRAGLAIEVSEDYTLTLRERVAHHWLLAMSNLQATAAHRQAQLERFRRFFVQSASGAASGARAFIIDAGNDPALLARTIDLCTAHGIRIDTLDEPVTIDSAFDYRFGRALPRLALDAGTWIIRTDQPMGRLAAALFERQTHVSDPETYDITAWSVPVAFGLRAHFTNGPIDAAMSALEDWQAPEAAISGTGEVAIIIDAQQHRFPEAIGLAAAHELFARLAGAAFTIDGRDFAAGSLIVHTIRNDAATLETFAAELLARGLSAHRVTTGLTERGPVLGANANGRLELPKILLLRGEPTSSLSFGQHWHLLDLGSPIPYTPVDVRTLPAIDLDDYNELILPDLFGDLSGMLGKDTIDRIERWVRSGATIVASGGAAEWASRTFLDLAPGAPGEARGASDEDERPPLSELTYQERRERQIADRIPGASLRVSVDRTHPLAAGVPAWLGIIKRGHRTLPVSETGSVIARFDPEPVIGGMASERSVNRLAGEPMMTHHRLGRGSVICLSDDVTIRGFQHGAMRLLLNAVTHGPSLGGR